MTFEETFEKINKLKPEDFKDHKAFQYYCHVCDTPTKEELTQFQCMECGEIFWEGYLCDIHIHLCNLSKGRFLAKYLPEIQHKH